jgi:shikimate dehydrogenase
MSDSPIYQLGLIGWPVEHSLSPIIHQAALKFYGLEGDYRLFPIPPLPEGRQSLAETCSAVRNSELNGFNVTIPHKQAIIPFLDRLTPSAQTIGAVNTVFLENGDLTGDNTDGDGFLSDLKSKFQFIRNKKTALVLGAGGSSRAVTHALGKDGWQVLIAARRLEQAQNLAKDLNRDQRFELIVYPLDSEKIQYLNPNLLVNTSPVGMTPDISESPWPLKDKFPEDCFVYDLIYNPQETLLVKQARMSGLKASNGLGMLVEQAALAFQRWTNLQAPRQEIYAALFDHPKNFKLTRETEK